MLANTNIESTGLNLEKAYRKVMKAVIVLFSVTFVLLVFPWLTSTASAGPGGTSVKGWVTRFDVVDVKKSVAWYEDVLGMKLSLDALPYYGQVSYPEYPDTQIGLNSNASPASGKATATIVVNDINVARDSIVSAGVDVEPICSAGPDVVLAFFCDPDGNNLALRQDGITITPPLPYCGAPKCNNCAS
ncbi:MAG: VOC family protein [Symploca sp. SIO3C6]|uniref:VOC family protein n=1 Tax=Symploca sp. SIO1C4 TaxID=2607765 RepID=A0A6B3NIC9_9CYAN|nr:VOC family protein [Symploca sp. SIO3C6]NER31507.1 VOC family protein [Symploca sp. SIO1C4]NET03229.1 VOC family protein [Symploca sp. SIO2B6]NET52332.1 VOC family protein [Merismopedia sp. SIO2A8]